MEKLAQDNKPEEASLDKIIYITKKLTNKGDENDQDLKKFARLIEENVNINVKNESGTTLLAYLLQNSIDQKEYLNLVKDILSRSDISINNKEDYYYNSYKALLTRLSICKERGLFKMTPKYLEIKKLMEAHPNFVEYSLKKGGIKALKNRVEFILKDFSISS